MPRLPNPVVAIVTPFTSIFSIDWPAFERYLNTLQSWGVEAIVTNGSTGEFASLTLEERKQVLAFAREHFKGTLVNHISATAVEDVRGLAAHSQAYADALLILPPYYYAGVGEKGLANYFEAALREAVQPIYLYNYPKHSGNALSPTLLSELDQRSFKIRGIKDSTGELENAKAIKNAFPSLEVYLGNDSKAFASLQAGLDGSVTGAGHALVEYLLAIGRVFELSPSDAEQIQDVFNAWNSYRKGLAVSEVSFVKASLAARIENFPKFVRPPFLPVDAVLSKELAKVLNEFRDHPILKLGDERCER